MLEDDYGYIKLSVNISSTEGDHQSVSLTSEHPYDETWTTLVEQFIRALNAYGFIIKGTNQLIIDPYGSVTRTRINEGPTDE